MLKEHEDRLIYLTEELISLRLDDEQVRRFSLYADLLIEWNEKFNLTSITDPEEMIVKHFIDSMTLHNLIKRDRIVDLGTGAGFPGIPLQILFPELKMVLVDSLAKRLDFIKAVVKELGLPNVEIVHARAEDFARDKKYRAKFDTVVSRAVARLPVLLEYSLPLLDLDGVFLASKGTKADEEISESTFALKTLGGKLEKVVHFNLGSEAENRSVVIVRKSQGTPELYPRKAGIPAKKPLL